MIDSVVPMGKWEFGSDVAACFEDMLSRSIPQYPVMRKAVTDMGARFIRDGTAIVDLGCSRGSALDPFVEQYGGSDSLDIVGVEVSQPMATIARNRFKASHNVVIQEIDLRENYPALSRPSSLTLCVLTLQFIPIEYRQQVLSQCLNSTVHGGALILVEKVIARSVEIDRAQVAIYYDMKKRNGYSDDAITRKRISLEGVLVPMQAAWNEDALKVAGFNHVECFWRWMNFAAWVAIR